MKRGAAAAVTYGPMETEQFVRDPTSLPYRLPHPQRCELPLVHIDRRRRVRLHHAALLHLNRHPGLIRRASLPPWLSQELIGRRLPPWVVTIERLSICVGDVQENLWRS